MSERMAYRGARTSSPGCLYRGTAGQAFNVEVDGERLGDLRSLRTVTIGIRRPFDMPGKTRCD